MRVYLAGPIDYVEDKGAGWRNEIKNMVWPGEQTIPIVFFDPVAPYSFTGVSDEVSAYIHNVNMCALREADVVVARMLKGQMSVGTPIELYEAVKRRIQIVLITDMDDSIYMRYIGIGSRVVRSVEEAIKNLITIECETEYKPSISIDNSSIPYSLRNLKFIDEKSGLVAYKDDENGEA